MKLEKFSSVFSAWKKEDRDAAVIRVQSRCIYMLCMLCILFCIGWMSAPSRIRIYIPPDISNGATLKINEIPNPLIYSFAYQIWQELNYWPEENGQNYKTNLHTFSPYLTPNFQAELLQENDDLRASGQIQRQRFVQGTSGAAFEVSNVKRLGSNTWEVDLTVRVMEYKNNQLVKDIEVLYPLKIIRQDSSMRFNPYGLALAGFVSPPARIKTYI